MNIYARLFLFVFVILVVSCTKAPSGLRADLELPVTEQVTPSMEIAGEIVENTMTTELRNRLIQMFPNIQGKGFRYYVKAREFKKRGEDGWTKYYIVVGFTLGADQTISNGEVVLDFLKSAAQSEIDRYYRTASNSTGKITH